MKWHWIICRGRDGKMLIVANWRTFYYLTTPRFRPKLSGVAPGLIVRSKLLLSAELVLASNCFLLAAKLLLGTRLASKLLLATKAIDLLLCHATKLLY